MAGTAKPVTGVTFAADASDRAGAIGAADAVKLDDVFRGNARRTPNAVALIDPPDRPAFTEGIPRRLTYREADQAVAMLAMRLQTLGLPAGAVVAMQLANTVESVIVLLAVARAGLVAAPLPLLWRKAEAAPALAQIGAQALIACVPLAGTDYNEIALNIAAETFSIKFVCGFGQEVADGMVALGDIFADGDAAAVSLASVDRQDSDGTAIVTFEIGPEGPCPIPHTDTALLVGGLAIVLETGMQRKAILLGTMLISSFAVLATTVVPWLLTGGTLALHQPFEPSALAAQLTDIQGAVAVLPGSLIAPMGEAGMIGGSEGPAIVGLWRSPERQPGSGRWRGATPLVDVLAFGEFGLLALRRGAKGEPASMKAGAVTVPSDAAAGTVIMNLARTARGTLALSGPMVPRIRPTPNGVAEASSLGADHFADTGYPCRIDPITRGITLSGPPAGVVHIGGYRFTMSELQDLIGRAGGDGVLAALPDLLTGQKLAGAAANAAALQRALAALGISPLIRAAFRNRSPNGRTPAA